MIIPKYYSIMNQRIVQLKTKWINEMTLFVKMIKIRQFLNFCREKNQKRIVLKSCGVSELKVKLMPNVILSMM